MKTPRLSGCDPRTIARDIPGVLDALFPYLAQGVVAGLNRRAHPVEDCVPVSEEVIATSRLQHAMLFEIAVAAAEQLLDKENVNWDACLETAVRRQNEHFDAVPPSNLSEVDREVSLAVARNLVLMLRRIQFESAEAPLVRSPRIPGYRWIASGVGDFAVGRALIEVKCTNKRFSSADYRQILMYWLLSYCSAMESGAAEWSHGILINPRLNLLFKFSFDEVVAVVGGGKSKLELVELFAAMLGERMMAG